MCRRTAAAYVLTVDNGVALLVMHKNSYIEKCMTWLSDQNLYQGCRGITKTIHNKVDKQLSDLK